LEIKIRNCREEDLDRITEIENSSFDDPYPYRLFVTFLADFPDGFRVAVLVDNGGIVGYCIVSSSERQDTMMISSIAVGSKFRKLGIGEKLLNDSIKIAEKHSSTNQIRRIILQVAVGNQAAKSLYEKFGFRNVRKIKDYYGKGKDGIQMELRLNDAAGLRCP
jgi:[ribosomal protein S18]-alanine N-acetyltransferase